MSYSPELQPANTEHNLGELQDAYRAANHDVLAELDIAHNPDWAINVSDVIVVLCASRSGSSLIFNALSSSGKVIAPGGEHEPWLTLTENKFPFQHSDRITGEIQQQDFLLQILRADMLVRDRAVDAEQVVPHVRNRLVVRRQQDVEGFGDSITKILERGTMLRTEWDAVLANLGRLSIKPLPTEIADIGKPEFGLPLENPPLIDQPLAHVASDDELKQLPLLFKSPSDAYRPGFYEQLFPNARVSYIHLTRGFVQTTNGLMDGWQKNDIDFISNPVGMIKPLDIDEYSITDMSKTYWCFDLFDEWTDYAAGSLTEIAVNQWLRAHKSIVENFQPSTQLTFEEFYSNPHSFYARLSDLTGVDTTKYDWSKSVMTTEPPSQMRWLKRASLFRDLKAHISGALLGEVIEMQDHLGYSMEEETWR
jgi:hypothetical protein